MYFNAVIFPSTSISLRFSLASDPRQSFQTSHMKSVAQGAQEFKTNTRLDKLFLGGGFLVSQSELLVLRDLFIKQISHHPSAAVKLNDSQR